MSFPSSVNSSSIPFQYSQLDLGFASRRDYGRPVDYPGRGAIGQPVQFTMGQFTGQTIRAQLTEIQKAELGRKYANVDRRNVDPPPIVMLRIFRVINPGTYQEYEQEIEHYESLQIIGFLCHIDLFPVPDEDSRHPGRWQVSPQFNAPTTSLVTDSQLLSFPSPVTLGPSDISPSSTYPSKDAGAEIFTGVEGMPSLPGTSDPDVVAHIGNHSITERSKLTSSMVGTTFVQPIVVDYKDKKTIMFVFPDIAVKSEGNFILRYRFFDLFSGTHDSHEASILAECYGGSFRVFSTKDFPGLPASTELTKLVSMYGLRLHIREVGRKRARSR
ncbi:hypothetical protein PLICRDRAFT_43633 [Plicaturopsis crispa FD-325 SS-3]|nr:hypothetical protein PLICRDRAFT_43633 [Plicaturopsis crispa FD-325 SS-3]